MHRDYILPTNQGAPPLVPMGLSPSSQLPDEQTKHCENCPQPSLCTQSIPVYQIMDAKGLKCYLETSGREPPQTLSKTQSTHSVQLNARF